MANDDLIVFFFAIIIIIIVVIVIVIIIIIIIIITLNSPIASFAAVTAARVSAEQGRQLGETTCLAGVR